MVKYQGEFSFMKNGEKYVVGEVLVNRNSFRQVTVMNIVEDELTTLAAAYTSSAHQAGKIKKNSTRKK